MKKIFSLLKKVASLKEQIKATKKLSEIFADLREQWISAIKASPRLTIKFIGGGLIFSILVFLIYGLIGTIMFITHKNPSFDWVKFITILIYQLLAFICGTAMIEDREKESFIRKNFGGRRQWLILIPMVLFSSFISSADTIQQGFGESRQILSGIETIGFLLTSLVVCSLILLTIFSVLLILWYYCLTTAFFFLHAVTAARFYKKFGTFGKLRLMSILPNYSLVEKEKFWLIHDYLELRGLQPKGREYYNKFIK